MTRRRADILVQVANDAARERKLGDELERARGVTSRSMGRAREQKKTLREIADASGFSIQRVEQRTKVDSRQTRRRKGRGAMRQIIGAVALAAAFLAVVVVIASDADATSMMREVVIGTHGDDHLEAGPGNDRIEALAGDDVLRGRAGDDVLIGGPGSDTFHGGSGADVFRCGAGFDVIVLGMGTRGAARAPTDDTIGAACEAVIA